MNESFSRTLSLLRQEKGISQRKAAGELGISQALLSHYENGAREPGLEFVVRACDFYHVSADFLLGRSMSRDGTTILDADTLYDASEERDNVLKGSVMATLSKKLIVNAVSVLFDLLGQLGNKDAIRAAAAHLSTGVYILFRGLFRHSPYYRQEIFSISNLRFGSGLPTGDMVLSVTDYVESLVDAENDPNFPDMSHDALTQRYPGAYQSLLQIIHSCGGRMARHLEHHQRVDK